jgi:hypothetical protein
VLHDGEAKRTVNARGNLQMLSGNRTLTDRNSLPRGYVAEFTTAVILIRSRQCHFFSSWSCGNIKKFWLLVSVA